MEREKVSSYIALARKWRPAQFSDIVGQAHIVRTLLNAVRLQKIHHAYLFTGSRGVGKTSIARIFAKVLRCQNIQEQDDMIRSCDQCSSRLEITASTSVDVIEIDGASNNGVDAVREIRDNTRYMPSFGTRKIYIIDEVHMLTTAAFNALLKTLEEPPPSIIFIFANTEPHKIPPTILSRCQKFDYRRVTVRQIQERLVYILQSENIRANPEALSLIARAAEGSMRDALSLLDQVIAFSNAFSGNLITVDNVRESIGLIEGSTLIRILAGIFDREPLKALDAVEQAYQQGFDLRILTRHLIEYLHAILLAKVRPTQTAEWEAEEWKEILALSERRSLEEMELIFQALHQSVDWIARSPQPKLVLDVLLIKCATAEALFYVNSPASVNAATSSVPASTPTTAVMPPATTASGPTPQLAPSKNFISREKTFKGFIETVKQARPLLASVLEHAVGAQLPSLNPDAFNRTMILYFSSQDSYFREQLSTKVYQEQFSQLAKEYFGTTIRLQIELKDSGESMAAQRQRAQKERLENIREKAQNHPIILEAKSLFGGQLGRIDIRGGQNAGSTT